MKAIFHCDNRWGIGNKGGLMFHIPKDMKFFKEQTLGGVVIMGYNTYRTLPDLKPLVGRTNIILSSKLEYAKGFITVKSLDELRDALKDYDTEKVFVIGGASIYKELLPYCDSALVTKVNAIGIADTFVDNLDENKDWKLMGESETVTDNGYDIEFCLYVNSKARKL